MFKEIFTEASLLQTAWNTAYKEFNTTQKKFDKMSCDDKTKILEYVWVNAELATPKTKWVQDWKESRC